MKKDIVSSLLKEGMVINTKLSSNNVWIQNILYKVENHSLSIALLSSYLENIVMIGQSLHIKYANEHTEYLFEGEITHIKPEFPSYITVNITSIKELKNIRVFPRQDVYLASNIRILDPVREYFAIIHNISLVGMAFYCKDILEPAQTQLEIFIYLPSKQTITAKGKIIRRVFKNDDIIDYGIQYTDMQEENNNSLSNFFNSIEEEKNNLRNEFITCIKKHL
ncbi:UNVERIFIED_CONTAM: PilZ domain-containing protein [Acetivibrio alkalicellulosi]